MSIHADNLRSIAQNDYMIDQHYLPEGRELNNAADHIEWLEAALSSLYDAGHNVIRRVAGDPDVDHMEMLHALTVALQNARPLVPTLNAEKGETT